MRLRRLTIASSIKLGFSISCMRISNPQHAPPFLLQAHLVLDKTALRVFRKRV
jgi:hypothetical protein